jgi:hypothetical protein
MTLGEPPRGTTGNRQRFALFERPWIDDEIRETRIDGQRYFRRPTSLRFSGFGPPRRT